MSTLQFQFGVITATPAALLALSVSGDEATVFIRRHLTGDWGDLDRHDKRLNEVALTNGGRLFSAYHLADGTKIYIITEADRSATTILLPEDY